MCSTCKFTVGDIVEHIGGRGNTGKVTKVTADKITVVFEDSSKDYNGIYIYHPNRGQPFQVYPKHNAEGLS